MLWETVLRWKVTHYPALVSVCNNRCPSMRLETKNKGDGALVSLLCCMHIRESVDSLCRDGADMPRPPYIGKACTRPNLQDLRLFR